MCLFLKIVKNDPPNRGGTGFSLARELNTLLDKNSLINGTRKNNPFLPIKRSLFWGSEKCAQTEAMIENYDDQNEAILRIYESGKFLETVLGILTS